MEIAKTKEAGEMLKWADVQKMKYTWNAVCESMRLEPPAQGAFKEVLTDFNFAGFNIPKGWKVHSQTTSNGYYGLMAFYLYVLWVCVYGCVYTCKIYTHNLSILPLFLPPVND